MNKIIVYMSSLVMLVFTVSAYDLTFFNTSENAENISFTGNETYTRYLMLPMQINLTYTNINMSFNKTLSRVQDWESDGFNFTTDAYVPIAGTYDIALDRGKQVKLQISGQDTELDKNMIEKLNDRFKHLVGN